MVRRGAIVISLWAVLAAASTALLPLLFGAAAPLSINAANTESQHAGNLVVDGFPGLGDEQFMLAFDSSEWLAAEARYQQVVDEVADAATAWPEVGSAVPIPATDTQDPHHYHLAIGVTGDDRARQLLSRELGTALQQVVDQASDGHMVVGLVGATPVLDQMVRSETSALWRIEMVAVPLAAVVLAIGLGTVGAATVPLLVAGAGVLTGLGLLAVLSLVVAIDVTMLTAMMTVGFGLGLDYSVLILLRYRRARARGAPAQDAAVESISTAGTTVAWCGLVIAVAACALLTVEVTAARTCAAGALLATAMAMASALTLPAALLPRMDRLLDRGRVRRDRAAGRGWESWARHLMRYPWRYVLGSGLVLTVMAVPTLGIDLGLRLDRDALTNSGTGHGMARMEDDQIAGTTVLVLPHHPQTGPADVYALLRGLRQDPRVSLVVPADNGDDLTVLIVGHRDPVDSPASAALIHDIRQDLGPRLLPAGQKLYLTGPSAIITDLTGEIVGRFWQVVALVLACSFVLLVVAFRSLVIPLKAIVMNLLTLGATFGLLTAVTGHLSDGAVNALLPVAIFTVVFGLSMDYEVFLVHRIAERYRATGDNEAAVAHGLRHTAQPITLAATVMVVALVGLCFTPRPDLRQLGFAAVTAIVIDVTLIRLVLVPALMRLLGDRNWWLPAPLARLLPPLPLVTAVTSAPPSEAHRLAQQEVTS
ncbi:MMPL family transporter [Amycolatopsis sp. QT-25]|uniref:MMPL family transporter n=1 Tax=Amycolatopsis sp. QT-25 TaxID=3034022 RepID=UPI0023EB4752|nr:MMPL family transporter [Amycolatopsis sp. QT-25]WET79023.1 MMPL family transporter [Amycolatopsis sp. QT-25]